MPRSEPTETREIYKQLQPLQVKSSDAHVVGVVPSAAAGCRVRACVRAQRAYGKRLQRQADNQYRAARCRTTAYVYTAPAAG